MNYKASLLKHNKPTFLNFRLAHYDIGGTNVVGSKLAAINLEARDIAAKHVLRKVVVARIR